MVRSTAAGAKGGWQVRVNGGRVEKRLAAVRSLTQVRPSHELGEVAPPTDQIPTRSRGHLAIPATSTGCVAAVPPPALSTSAHGRTVAGSLPPPSRSDRTTHPRE